MLARGGALSLLFLDYQVSRKRVMTWLVDLRRLPLRLIGLTRPWLRSWFSEASPFYKLVDVLTTVLLAP